MAMVSSLYRLEDNLWKVQLPSKANRTDLKEVHIQTPEFNDHTLTYKIAVAAANALRDLNPTESVEVNGLTFDLRNQAECPLNRRWKFTLVDESPSALKNWIPFFHKIPPKNTIKVKIVPSDTETMATKLWNKIVRKQNEPDIIITAPIELPTLTAPYKRNADQQQRLNARPFSDPFTTLSAKALQTIESKFVYGPTVEGQYRFEITSKGTLELKPIENDGFVNQDTVSAYYHFILQEYGKEVIEVVEHSFAINFKQMISSNSPLLPDHVFKVNIGVNEVRIDQIESLYARLHKLKSILSKNQQVLIFNLLSIREIRGLFALSGTTFVNGALTLNTLVDFLTKFFGKSPPESPCKLSSEKFNQLVNILVVPDDDRNNIYTGRKIEHLAICGYPTMGDKNVPNNARNLHELLQTYPDMQTPTGNFNNFYELLAHVAVKKELFRECPATDTYETSEYKVGTLLPAPKDAQGCDQWYMVKNWVDDGEGGFSYFLEPACLNYRSSDGKALPAIKLYRSTASNRNAVNSEDTLQADANAHASPGSLHPEKAIGYENPSFDARTIPVWVGYFMLGEMNNENPEAKLNAYRTAFNELIAKKAKLTPEQLRQIETFEHQLLNAGKSVRIQNGIYQNFLNRLAIDTKEHPSFKTPQDIIFVGHSLGGSLAQYGMGYQSGQRERIPCPGYSFILHAEDPPATDSHIHQKFMEFGRKHKFLIEKLGQHWEINYQMEYGDFVPEAGDNHLGALGYTILDDAGWLKFNAKIFKPLPTAEDLAITTCTTHGRRIGLAQEGLDYSIQTITAEELSTFDDAWLLGPTLRGQFGYRIVVSPKITELSRRVIGLVVTPILHLHDTIKDAISPPQGPRTANGIAFVEHPSYSGPLLV